MNIGYRGFYKLSKKKVKMLPNGLPDLDSNGNYQVIKGTTENYDFENLIPNSGLNGIGRLQAVTERCWVSADTTEPTFTTTVVGSILGESMELSSSVSSSDMTSNPIYQTQAIIYRFEAGNGTGNISKIAVGWNEGGNNYWSISLVKDTSGAPVVITKLADEILDVTYELRVYVSTTDFKGSVTIASKRYNVIARPSINNPSLWFDSILANNTRLEKAEAYAGFISGIYERPDGLDQNVLDVSITTEGYVNGSYRRGHRVRASVSQGNFLNGIRSFVVSYDQYRFFWQIQFSDATTGAAIPKTPDYTFTSPIVYISWGRYVAS